MTEQWEGDVTNHDMEELSGMLREVIEKAQEISRRAGQEGMSAVENEMEAYLIPHLQCWVDDDKQMGSIPSLMNTVDGYGEDGE